MKKLIPASYGVGVNEDKNNCVVRALANTTGKDYWFLHNKAKIHGRKDKHGMCSQSIIALHKALGIELFAIYGTTCGAYWYSNAYNQRTLDGTTLGRFIKEHPKGKFIVAIRGHHTSVIDGTIVDSFSQNANARVTAVWVV